MKNLNRLFPLLLTLILFISGCGAGGEVVYEDTGETAENSMTSQETVVEGDSYSTPQKVTDYIELYGELPPNYLTKDEAREMGWDADAGNLWDVSPGSSIGGDYFGNYEGLLPEESGRDYYEADINYEGGYRNAERLVFSNDGLYFYTDDHYETFTEIKPGGDL